MRILLGSDFSEPLHHKHVAICIAGRRLRQVNSKCQAEGELHLTHCVLHPRVGEKNFEGCGLEADCTCGMVLCK